VQSQMGQSTNRASIASALCVVCVCVCVRACVRVCMRACVGVVWCVCVCCVCVTSYCTKDHNVKCALLQLK